MGYLKNKIFRRKVQKATRKSDKSSTYFISIPMKLVNYYKIEKADELEFVVDNFDEFKVRVFKTKKVEKPIEEKRKEIIENFPSMKEIDSGIIADYSIVKNG